MITRIFGDRRTRALTRRIDRPEAVLLAIAQAVLAAVGWLVMPVWVAAVVAGQLALGGLGGVRVIGPARSEVGFAAYTMPATAGVAATLFGRLLPGGVSLLLVPLVAVLLWIVVYLELRAGRLPGGRTVLELLSTVILFAAAAGILALFPEASWPPPVALVTPIAAVVSLRAAEARGLQGAESVGQALLHLLAVMQVAAATVLLDLPGVVGPAVVALAFYAWGGAADALRSGSSGRSVAVEFGALAVLGLVVAMLLHRG